MHHTAIVMLVLLSAVGALLILSRVSRVPYPIVLVVGGVLLGFVPGIPSIALPPSAILLVILPPLVFYAALVYQANRFRENASSISLLALGLLTGTTAGVAAVAHVLIGLPWAAAFVLGAVLSPTDPVTATAIASRLGAPRRVTAVIEGESLVNDGCALVLYTIAVGVVTGGNFSLGVAALRLPVTILGGIAIGLLVAWFVSWALLRRLGDGYHMTVLVLLTAYLSYLSADVAGTSGVLAAVTAGVYIGRRMPVDDAPSDRIAGYSFFEVLVFLINALVFILMGLQFPDILERISQRPPGMLLLWATVINLTVIALRMTWCMGFGQIVFRIDPSQRKRYTSPPWRQSLVIGWAGMRGAVSLAAALAIPLQLADGAPFPGRGLILFLTITVILVTVVIQGLSLPAVIRALRIGGDSGEHQAEINRARRLGAQEALNRIEQLREQEWLPEGVAELLRDLYMHRDYALTHGSGEHEDDIDHQARYDALLRLRRELIDVERSVMLRLNSTGEISDDAMRQVERILDLEESRYRY